MFGARLSAPALGNPAVAPGGLPWSRPVPRVVHGAVSRSPVRLVEVGCTPAERASGPGEPEVLVLVFGDLRHGDRQLFPSRDRRTHTALGLMSNRSATASVDMLSSSHRAITVLYFSGSLSMAAYRQ